MLKKAICIIIFTLITFASFSLNFRPKFRLIGDFFVSPYFSDTDTFTDGYSINTSLFCGIQMTKISIGAELSENYYGIYWWKKDIMPFSGWTNVFRGTIVGLFEPVRLFELKWGIGGVWNTSSFDLNNINIISNNYGGVTFSLDFILRPFKYIQLALINKLDVLLALDYSNRVFYDIKFRINCHPNVDFLNLYMDAGITSHLYDEITEEYAPFPVFVWSIGVSIDIALPYDSGKKFISTEDDELILAENIRNLKNAKEGDIIIFENILFYPDSDEIKKESLNVIDAIALTLLERRDMHVEIGGHTNYTGFPVAELKLSQNRAKMVKKLLIKRGIEDHRLKVFGYGGLFSKGTNIKEEKRRVEIRVLSVGEPY